MKLFRYAVVRICHTNKTFYTIGKHIFLFEAINEMKHRQNNENESALNWGYEYGILDRKTGSLASFSLMLKTGVVKMIKEET